MMCKTEQRNVGGFTLIELLVVIAIIAVLLAVIAPALNKAKEQALKLVDASQLKDLGTAFSMFTGDNNGELPPNSLNDVTGSTAGYYRWMVHLAPYYDTTKKTLEATGYSSSYELYAYDLYRCSVEKKMHRGTGDAGAVGTYGYNDFFSNQYDANNDKIPDKPYNFRKYSDIRLHGEFPVMACLSSLGFTSTSYSVKGTGGLSLLVSPPGPHPMAINKGYNGGVVDGSVNYITNVFGPAPNHGRMCNFLFADWHVEARDVCDKKEWPWFDKWGNDSGSAFHPKRLPKSKW